MQIDVTLGITGGDSNMDGIGDKIFMREHNPFRPPGRTSCVEETGQIILLHLLIRTGPVLLAAQKQFLIVEHTFRRLITGIDKMLNSRNSIAPCDIRGEVLIDKQSLRLAVIEDKNDFGTRQTVVERHNHRAHAPTDVIQLQIAMAVEHENSNSISALYT